MARSSRWDRPPSPRNLRWFLRGVGMTMVSVGLLLLGFVAYQLWGTGIENSREQSRLRDQFEQRLEAVDAVPPVVSTGDPLVVTVPPTPPATEATDITVTATSTKETSTTVTSTTVTSTTAGSTTAAAPATIAPTTTTAPTTTAAPTTTTAPTTTAAPTTTTAPTTTAAATTTVAPTTTLPTFDLGEVSPGADLARIEAPAVDLDWIVVSGVGTDDLRKGPGHYPYTPFPGELGNAAIAGHRTTYNGPFDHIVDLEVGDDIILTTTWGRFVYVVTGYEIVGPNDVHVVATTDPTVATLTLTTCHPRATAEKRYIVYAELDLERSSTPGAYTPRDELGVPLAPPTTTTTTTTSTTSTTTSSTSTTSTTTTSTSPTSTSPTSTSPTTTTAAAAPASTPVDDTLIAPAAPPSPGASHVEATAAETTSVETTSSGTAVSETTTVGTSAVTAPATSEPVATTVSDDPVVAPLMPPPAAFSDALSTHWFSDTGAWPHIVIWGGLCLLIATASWLLAKRYRNLAIGVAAGLVPFVVTLYFFYQNVNRLLPAAF